MTEEKLLEVNHLKKYFTARSLFANKSVSVKAVDDASFTIEKGKTLGLVGESGSGKSTLGRTVLRLIEADSGEISFNGTDIRTLPDEEMRKLRSDMQIVFQDPYSSLNPRMTVRQMVEEPILIHEPACTEAERNERVRDMIHLVGLNDEQLNRYPHEFSGGQRQRVGIARALILKPRFVVCDEPVSALDVSVQSQIINLLCDLQKELDLTYLFIAHGLNVVKYVSERVAVMYLGKILEIGDAKEIYTHPAHPYTQALMSAIVDYKRIGRNESRTILQGEIPSPFNPPSGCRFSTRCPYATAECREKEPDYKIVGADHMAACFRL